MNRGEECDAGAANGTPEADCTTDCLLPTPEPPPGTTLELIIEYDIEAPSREIVRSVRISRTGSLDMSTDDDGFFGAEVVIEEDDLILGRIGL